jgi:3-hydroxyacyl-CoA dehydrogenase/enoyl-CoA hydratase/3-hydroxybutyryl-CoA epimerase
MENFKIDVDSDGIALVTFDVPGRSMNTLTASVIKEIGDVVERIKTDEAIKGAVITSGKAERLLRRRRPGRHGRRHAGRRLLQAAFDAGLALNKRVARSGDLRQAGRRGHQRPGLGGGLELTLACHYRVVGRQSEDPARPARDQGRPVPGRRRHPAPAAPDRRPGRR